MSTVHICREQILGQGNRHCKVPKGRTLVSRSILEQREGGREGGRREMGIKIREVVGVRLW